VKNIVKESLSENVGLVFEGIPQATNQVYLKVNKPEYWEKVAKFLGGKLTEFSVFPEGRSITIAIKDPDVKRSGFSEFSDPVEDMNIGTKDITISQSWKHDGSSTKPVTIIETDVYSISLGRYPIWNDPESYAEDIMVEIEDYIILDGINEKFEEESDPIKDMAIGLVILPDLPEPGDKFPVYLGKNEETGEDYGYMVAEAIGSVGISIGQATVLAKYIREEALGLPGIAFSSGATMLMGYMRWFSSFGHSDWILSSINNRYEHLKWNK